MVVKKSKDATVAKNSLVAETSTISQISQIKKEKNPMMLPSAAVTNKVISKKRWGIDNTHKEDYWEREYWFDDRIHSLGNRYV